MITITKLHAEIVETAKHLLKALEFDKEHRQFLEQHEEKYFVAAADRICFFDSARLDVIGHFGPGFWTPEPGGYVKKIDGFTVKLLTDVSSAAPITLTAKKPSPLPFLDAVATGGCKITIPVYGDN